MILRIWDPNHFFFTTSALSALSVVKNRSMLAPP